MKKILSTLLVAAMLLSMVIVASIPASAADGQWTTYGPASEYADDYSGDPTSVPGYEYTDDGLRVIPADWTEQIVYGTVQTKDPVNIEDGVYMEFRVDAFDGADADNWFSFTIWDSENVEPGKTQFGSGVMTLIRIKKDAESDKLYFDYTDWYTDGFTSRGQTCEKDDNDKDVKKYLNDDGTFSMYLSIKMEGGKYVVDINGAIAPASVSEYIATKFADGEAYIGVTYRHGHTGGTVDMTITKFGTTEASATAPDGSDSKEPVDNSHYHVKAPIADPATVPAGEPCFLLTGNLTDSATKQFYGNQGGEGYVGDDFTMHIVSPGSAWTSFIVDVKNDVSYDIDDFPVLLLLTKNFCMCDDPDNCYAVESIAGHLMTGEQYAAGGNKFPEMDICWEPIIIEEGEKAGQYLYFWFDSSDDIIFEAKGRINSVRFDVSGLKFQEAGRNSIDVEFIAFFRNTDEAEEYVYKYLGLAGGDDETTEKPTEESTEKSTDESTEKPTEEPTEEPTIESSTEVPTEKNTEKQPTEEPTEGKTTEAPKSNGGCGSVIGAGAAMVVALVVACGVVAFRKKGD